MTRRPTARRDLDVLQTLTQAISQARSIESIYAAALDALAAGLGVERASILLFDPDGVMRFKAWRGLSDGYRRAVEGHTPWSPDSTDAEPIVVEDVRRDPGLAPFLPIIDAEGIAAMAFLPLVTGRRVIGKFMVYYGEPHAADPGELKLAGVIAAQVAFAVHRTRAEQAARERELELRLITDAAPVSIARCGRDHRYRFVNRTYAARFGLEPADIVGKTIAEVLGDAAYSSIAHQLDVVLSGQASNYEMEVPYERLGSRIVHVQYVPEFDERGDVFGFVGVIVDITERREAEIALRRSEALFRQLADALPQIIWTAHPDGTAEYYNERWYESTGQTRSAAELGTWLAIVHRDDATAAGEAWSTALSRGEIFQMEIRLLDRRTGSYRWHLARALPLRDADGRLLRVIGSATDIDDHRRADQQKDEFLAVLAHELRNPLAPIRTALQLVRLEHLNHAEHQRACEVMDRQVQQLVRLVDDLLDVSRITRGAIELQKERLELPVALQNAIETSRPIIEGAGHAFTVTFPSEAIYVDADSTRLSQVFSNLLNNAAKYTPRGGHISMTAERRGDAAVVSVKDSGVGIPEEMLARIFDLFTQVDRSLEKTHGGLGIGLTLAKTLVEMHGGTVAAHSLGAAHGSEFVVTLPLGRASALTSEPDAEARPSSRTGARHRVLVADDNSDAADCLAELLRFHGHEVRTAGDGLEAVEAAQTFAPDAVLLDLGMPRLNGYDAARRLRTLLGDRVMLVAVTGWGQQEDRRRSQQVGFDHHLIKPIDAHALNTLLTEWLQRVKAGGADAAGRGAIAASRAITRDR